MLLQPLRWCCIDCVITTNGMCVKNNTIMYVARTSNNRVISSGDLYCCLLPRCKALRTCRSGFQIATVLFLHCAQKLQPILYKLCQIFLLWKHWEPFMNFVWQTCHIIINMWKNFQRKFSLRSWVTEATKVPHFSFFISCQVWPKISHKHFDILQ